MPRRILALTALLVLATCLAAPAETPTSLAGIALGDVAARSKGRIAQGKPRAVDAAPWLQRQSVTPDKFFSGGYVLIGACAAPGRVVRVKMRYRDDSLEMFRKISGEMLARYGDPAEYKGELDGRVMGNKWAFSDPWLRPVSLILQRSEGADPELGAGNTVKLTNWGLLEAERACWQERHASPKTTPAKDGKAGPDNGYLPR
jgi:hypothetical protein